MRTAVIIGFFTLAVVLFLWGSFFGPRIFLDTNPYHYEPWKYYGTQEDRSNETYRTDSFVTYLPRIYELSNSIRSGRFPLWNPYIFGGMPFFADPQTRVVYPISLLLAPLDPARAMGYDIGIHLLIAMIGMYLFLRTIGVNTLGSLVGAFSYPFSSYFYVRMGHPTFVSAASWIPFFFYGFERARKGGRTGTILLIIFLAMGYLAGSPQVFVFGVGALVVYALYTSLDAARGERAANLMRTVKVLGIAGVLSALLVSVQLIPFIEFFRNSIGLSIEVEKMRDVFVASPLVLIRSVVPHFFGHPIEETDWSGLTRAYYHPYNPDFAVYCGIGTLLAAVGCVVFLRRSARIRALLVILILSIAVATNPLLLEASYKLLPVLRVSRISRVAVLSCFALSAMGAIGLSTFSSEKPTHMKRQFAYLIVAVAAGVLVASLILNILGGSLITTLQERARSLPDKAWLQLHAQTRSIKIREWADGPGTAWLAYERKQILRTVLFVIPSAGLLLAYGWRRLKSGRLRTAVGICFVVLLFTDVGLVARSYFISQPSGCLFETKSIEVLKERLGNKGQWRIRTIPYRNEVIKAMPPNTNRLHEIHSVSGTSAIVPDGYRDLRDAFSGVTPPAWMHDIGTPFKPAEMLLTDFACVRYAVGGTPGKPFVSSPIIRIVAAKCGNRYRVRLFRLAGDSRQTIHQYPGEILNLSTDLPSIKTLDFAVGFNTQTVAPGESLTFWLRLKARKKALEFSQRFDLHTDRDRWHDFRLDVTPVRDTHVNITMAISAPDAVAEEITAAGWSGLDLVFDACDFGQIPQGYTINVPGGAEFLSLELRSPAREVPLEVGLGDDHKSLRWIGFPSDLPIRRVTIDVREKTGGKIAVVSDSAFVLDRSKVIHLGPAYPYYDVISDEDMYVYENFAAIDKGICLDSRHVERVSAGSRSILKVASLYDFTDVRCGTCKISSYEPERVELDVSADRSCVLVFQDTYYPGWRARVDGKEAEILRTDAGVRALDLEKGHHAVVMEFRPGSVRLGLILTCLGIVLSLGYGLLSRRARSRPEVHT